MASSTLIAGAGANDASVGSIAWNNPNNITTEGVTNPSSPSLSEVAFGFFNGTSNYLKATNFGFSIPTGATIDGIVVSIYRAAGGATITDSAIRLVKGGTIGSTNRSAGATWSITPNFTLATYGSSSDLWGTTWTAADINASNFGTVLSVTGNSGSASANVDYIKITVYYHTAAQFTKTHTTDVLLRKAVTKTHTVDALLRKATVAIHTTDSYLRSRLTTRSHTTDSLLRATRTNTHTTDAILVKRFSKTHATDALLFNRIVRTHTTDAYLKATQSGTPPRMRQEEQDRPAIKQKIEVISFSNHIIRAPAQGVPASPLMDDTSALMDDPVYLMGGIREYGGEIPHLLNNLNTPRMKNRTEQPSMKNVIS